MKKLLLKSQYSIIACFCLLLANLVQGQERDEIVNVSEYPIDCIVPPEGFVTKDGLPGYLHWSTKSSILVSMVNGKNIIDAEAALNEEYFDREGVTLISKEKIQTDSGEEALLYKFSFVIKEEMWYRYSIFIGDLNGVLWINGSYMAKYEPVVEDSIVASLKTTKFIQK